MGQPAGFPRRDLLGGTVAGLVFGALPPAKAFADSVNTGETQSGRDGMTTDAEWSRFLAGQDPRWERLPRTWYEGPFLGDGFVGTQVYRDQDALNEWDVGNPPEP